jgi:hypothetical protein
MLQHIISPEKLNKLKSSIIILEKEEQNDIFSDKGEEINIFPNITINLEDQSINQSCNLSKDGLDFNQICFSTSPLFSSKRMYEQFNIRTPRVYSPGAFNFCSGLSTAHSYGNYINLAGKE